MSVLSVIQQVCPVIGLSVPTAVFSQSDRDSVELAALANEMAQRIAFDTHDWSALKVLCTLTGDGLVGSFDLPSDYQRMLKKARLWPSNGVYSALTHYPDSDTWLGMQVQSFSPTVGGWTIIGDKIYIAPSVPNTSTVKFYYLSSNVVKSAAGALQASFIADTDTFRLNERLLKLGMIWQWRAYKGVGYAEDLANYEDALASRIGSDKGSNILTMGQQRMPANWEYAFPGSIVP